MAIQVQKKSEVLKYLKQWNNTVIATNGIGSATKSSQVLVARPNAPQVLLGDTNCINRRVKLVAQVQAD